MIVHYLLIKAKPKVEDIDLPEGSKLRDLLHKLNILIMGYDSQREEFLLRINDQEQCWCMLSLNRQRVATFEHIKKPLKSGDLLMCAGTLKKIEDIEGPIIKIQDLDLSDEEKARVKEAAALLSKAFRSPSHNN